jgi:GTP-binding protein
MIPYLIYFSTLDATEEAIRLSNHVWQLASKVGWARLEKPTKYFTELLEDIITQIPAPVVPEGSLQMQITSLDYSSFTGRIAIGRILRGNIKVNQP